MSIYFKRGAASTAKMVAVALLLLIAVVSLVISVNPDLLQRVRNLAQVTATQDKVIFSPSSSVVCTDDTTKASVASGAGENGGNALLINTTRWAGAMIQFSGACGNSINFGEYDRVEFHIKGTSASPDPLTIYLHSYGPVADSAFATINSTASWSTVSVPILTLKGSGSWDLSNTQELRFKETTNGSSYYIDSIVLKAAGSTTQTPVVTLSASPTSITSGQSATLTWSSTNNPTSCTASGGWSGSKPASGSETVNPTTNTTYTLTCANTGGTSAPVNTTVNVTVPTNTYQPITVKGWTLPANTQSFLPGSTVNFSLNWIGGNNVPSPKIGGSWTVFIHVINSAGKDVWGSGFLPTQSAVSWAGDVVTPTSFQIPSNVKAGTYSVLVGLYNGTERLALSALSPARDMGAMRYYVGSFSVVTATNNLTPVISSIGLTYCIQDVFFCRQDIRGSNFALTGNNIKLTHTTTGAVTSLGINGTSIGNLASGDGTQIVADVPSNLPVGRYNLTDTVTVNGATKTSNAITFDMLPISDVTAITSVTPTSGPLGQVVTISGTHIAGLNTVQIGPFYFNNVSPNDSGNLVVTIPQTTPYTAYIGTPLKVYVDNDSYGYSGDNPKATQYTFTILSGSQTDTTKPIISNVASSTTATTATVTWSTNEPADTQVLFGSSISYGSNTGLDTTKVTSHTATITGLSANSIYNFSVNSRDAAGNLATSTNLTFRTQPVIGDVNPPLQPTGVTATAVSSSQINLTWGASFDDVGVTGYRVIRNNAVVTTTAGTVTSYSDTGLTPSTSYSYVVKSIDAAGNVSASSTPAASATTQPVSNPSGTIDTTGGKLIWDGVINPDDLTCGQCLYGGSLVTSVSPTSGPVFRSTTTTSGFSRVQISTFTLPSKFDKLVFWIKSNQSAGATVNFELRNSSSGTIAGPIKLNDFVSGNVIDTTYRQVAIPTNLLTGTGVYFMAFITSSNVVIDVDSFYLVDTIPNSVKSVSAISNGTLKIVVADGYSTTNRPALTDFVLRSSDGTLTPINPSTIGLHYYPTNFNGGGLIPDPNSPVMEYVMYLNFNTALVNGKSYILTANHLKDADGIDIPTPQNITFVYDDNIVNGSVKANQVGYLPVSPKYAYVGNYLGDALGMPVPSGTECRIMKVGTGQVATAPLAYRGDDPLMSGEKVYSCDFSSYQPTDLTAQYYVYVPGVGKSYNFRIASDVYNNVFKTVLRGLYYQRSGTALLAANAGIWARPAGHVANDSAAIVHSTVRTQSNGVLHPLSSSLDVPNTTVNLLKGWYDAGDFGKYIGSASVTLNELLTAYEMFPSKFADSQLNIPESGNGVPDILDEARWELEWMKNMQSPNGGVYHKVATTNWTQTMPAGDTAPMYISEKSTHATAQYAATLAKAARDFKSFDATFASDLQVRAVKAWDFLEANPTAVSFGMNPPCPVYDKNGVLTGYTNCNPPGIGGGENTDKDDAWDERALAAAELYQTTGDAKYKTAFYKYIKGNPIGDWMIYGAAASQRASFVHAFNPAVQSSTDPADTNFLATFRSGLKTYVADIVNRTPVNRYRNSSYVGDTEGGRKGNGWGAYSQGTRYAWELIKAAKVIEGTGVAADVALAQQYRETAKISFDAQLGNNPLNKTFITGIGSNSPMQPLHTISSLDGIDAPVPGIPIYGVHHDYTHYDAVDIGLKPNVYPGDVTAGGTPYPTLRNYWDIRSIVETGEFTILDFGYTAAAYAYFSN